MQERSTDTVDGVDDAGETNRQAAENKTSTQDNVITPGKELPGAFPDYTSTAEAPAVTRSDDDRPGLDSEQQVSLRDQPQATLAAQNMPQTASVGVLESAERAARQYLPASVVGTLEGAGVLGSNANGHNNAAKASRPSQETSSEPKSSDGVDAIGSSCETKVGKIPAEHASEDQMDSSAEKNNTRESTVDESATKHAGMTGEDVHIQQFPDKSALDAEDAASGSDHAAAQYLDSSVNISPVVTPERTDVRLVTNIHNGTQHSAEAAASTTSPDSDVQAVEHKMNKPLPAPSDSTNTNPSEPMNTGSADGYDRGEKRAEVTSPNHAQTPSGTETRRKGEHAEQGDETKPAQDRELSESDTHVSEDGPTRRKPSFSQRIRGEAKIIAGKLSKDSKKVETGKAMKEGYA